MKRGESTRYRAGPSNWRTRAEFSRNDVLGGALIRWTVRFRAHSPRARPGAGVGFRVALGHARVSRVSARARGRGGALAPRAGVGRARARGGDAGAGGLVSGRASALGRARGVERGGAAAREARGADAREAGGAARAGREPARGGRGPRRRRARDSGGRGDGRPPSILGPGRGRSSRGPPPPGVAADRAAPVAPRADAAIHSLDPPAVVAGRARASPDRPDASDPAATLAGLRWTPTEPSAPSSSGAATREYALRRGRDRSASVVDRANALLETVARRFRGGTPRTGRLVSGGLAS